MRCVLQRISSIFIQEGFAVLDALLGVPPVNVPKPTPASTGESTIPRGRGRKREEHMKIALEGKCFLALVRHAPLRRK